MLMDDSANVRCNTTPDITGLVAAVQDNYFCWCGIFSRPEEEHLSLTSREILERNASLCGMVVMEPTADAREKVTNYGLFFDKFCVAGKRYFCIFQQFDKRC